MKEVLLSAVCPVYNEERNISRVLDFFVRALPVAKELIIADGGSSDRTRGIIKAYAEKHPEIRLIDNPRKYVSFALNESIRSAGGKFIVRLDAHTEYADDYFTKIIETFEGTGADIVGGPMRAIGKTPVQRAVAVCTSTPFGVGDSSFHDDRASGEAESVYLGAWRKEIFSVTGYFDEKMMRNQDDEFHYRARSRGMRIWLNPEITSWYFPRSSFRLLFRQYFQYGLFKPLVLKKVRSGIRIRHLIPSGFVLYLLLLLLLHKHALTYVPLVIYLMFDFWFSLSAQKSWREKMLSLLVYPVLHIAYGTGFLLGLGKIFSAGR